MSVNTLPWYREPWPWLLMAGPVLVIIAGVITTWIAVVSSDGLVTDDYYKQGLAINQTLDRGALAVRRGYRGELHFGEGRNVTLNLGASADAPRPELLRLRVVHPTRAGRDALVLLRRGKDGSYLGVVPELAAGRWLLVLEDADATWRIDGELKHPEQAGTTLAANRR